ncbi:hypothetical protein J6590_065139 [Homalodisca vitripennis]|nr:hypothetical protein J6590_065139 [Homalodisca vitripennis]
MLSNGMCCSMTILGTILLVTLKPLVLQFRWEPFDHPPYNPDLASSDYHLFLHIKSELGGLEEPMAFVSVSSTTVMSFGIQPNACWLTLWCCLVSVGLTASVDFSQSSWVGPLQPDFHNIVDCVVVSDVIPAQPLNSYSTDVRDPQVS